ncbi:MAG TPA: MFS transporter [Victivallales bacterium]|nr:MFS transporter [Victivallales bacterium]
MEEFSIERKNNFVIYIPLLLTILIDALGVGIVYPVFATVFSTSAGGVLVHGFSETTANLLYGITVAAFPVAMLIGAPILGDLSDHVGRKKVLLICLFGEAVGMFFSACGLELNSILLLIIARAFTGLLAGSMGLAQASIVDISTPEKKTINLSLISLAASLGFTLGPLIGGELASLKMIQGLGYSGPFIFAGILAFLNGLLLAKLFTETSNSFNTSKINVLKGIFLLIDAFKDKRFRYVSLVLLFVQLSWSMYFQTTSLSLVQVFHYSISDLGHFISYLSLIYAFALLVLIRIAVRLFHNERILKFSITLLLIGYIISSLMILSLEWSAVPFIAIGVGLAYMVILTMYSNLADAKSQGWAMGAAASITAAGWGLGSIIAGFTSSFSFPLTYVVASMFILLSLIISLKKLLKVQA